MSSGSRQVAKEGLGATERGGGTFWPKPAENCFPQERDDRRVLNRGRGGGVEKGVVKGKQSEHMDFRRHRVSTFTRWRNKTRRAF